MNSQHWVAIKQSIKSRFTFLTLESRLPEKGVINLDPFVMKGRHVQTDYRCLLKSNNTTFPGQWPTILTRISWFCSPENSW
jgi:hypothetical protein